MSAVNFYLKGDPRMRGVADLTPRQTADLYSEWVTGKARVVHIGDWLFARDAIAGLRIID